MHSFTSNSNDRIPNLPNRRTWLFIALSAILFITIWNFFWLSRKVPTLPKDNAELWAYHRRRVAHDGENAIVLIGSSRMQTGLNQEKFAELVGRKPVQLAMVGESPVPLLKHFAEDETFRGTIISDFPEFLVYQKEFSQVQSNTIESWIHAYKESKSSDDFEFWLRNIARNFVASPQLGKSPPDAIKNMIDGEVFRKPTVDDIFLREKPVYFDRSLIFDMDKLFTKSEIEEIMRRGKKTPIDAMKNMLNHNPPTPEKYKEITKKIEGYIHRIQSRGGKVIIVNFPFGGELWNLNEQAFPKKEFWNEFASSTSAKVIHFKDYPTLSNFNCPDDSHLDGKDTPEFTENLVKIIYETK